MPLRRKGWSPAPICIHTVGQPWSKEQFRLMLPQSTLDGSRGDSERYRHVKWKSFSPTEKEPPQFDFRGLKHLIKLCLLQVSLASANPTLFCRHSFESTGAGPCEQL